MSELSTTVSPKELTFKPGGDPVAFEVTAINESDRLASFQLEIIAAGTEDDRQSHWYNISPEVSTKQPPGAETQFQVEIVDSPIPGFVGLMTVTARVFSIELSEEEREVLRLTLERGTHAIPLKLELPMADFQGYPGSQIDFLARVYNPSQLRVRATIKLLGLDPSWLEEGGDFRSGTLRERSLQISPGKRVEIPFSCNLPVATQTLAQVYPFQVEATQDDGPPSAIAGTIEVLPKGVVEFRCETKEKRIPPKRSWLPGWKAKPAQYDLAFENQSNLAQQVSLTLQNEESPKCQIEVVPEQIDVMPGETQHLQLVARSRRPLLGRGRRILLEVGANLSDERLGKSNPPTQILKLKVAPKAPLWMQIASIPVFLWLLWLVSWLNPKNPFFGHQEAVNSVQFNGTAQELASASNDQSLIAWDTKGFFRPWIKQEIGQIGDLKKAGRILRYRPVNNDMLAVGLENGDIQLWDDKGIQFWNYNGKRIDSFSYQKDDRVLALAFTQNSNFLFSGHGSGMVLQWPLMKQRRQQLQGNAIAAQPRRIQQFNFAVYAMAFVDPENEVLAIAGRFNQLVLWNWQTNVPRTLPYPTGGKDDYIFSLDAASLKPELLATADNQGRITLWNVQDCAASDRPCTMLDRWADGHGGRPVRSVALTDDGCYLASGGDDGKIMLWPLSFNGARASTELQGREVNRAFENNPVNTVDVKQVLKKIFIASGSNDTQVRVDRVPHLPQLGCER